MILGNKKAVKSCGSLKMKKKMNRSFMVLKPIYSNSNDIYAIIICNQRKLALMENILPIKNMILDAHITAMKNKFAYIILSSLAMTATKNRKTIRNNR